MLDAIVEAIKSFIESVGYPGIFILMVLESTLVPVPSIVVMGFAGVLAHDGRFSLPLVILMNTLGALVGSWLFYQWGARGGKPLLLRVGKWFLLRPADIEKTEAYFHRPRLMTVFVARLIPVVRHFISFVAGLGHMPMRPFLIQTLVGATLWGGLMATLGYFLASQWDTITKYMKPIEYVIGGLIVVAAIYLVLRFRKRRQAERERAAAGAPTAAA